MPLWNGLHRLKARVDQSCTTVDAVLGSDSLQTLTLTVGSCGTTQSDEFTFCVHNLRRCKVGVLADVVCHQVLTLAALDYRRHRFSFQGFTTLDG